MPHDRKRLKVEDLLGCGLIALAWGSSLITRFDCEGPELFDLFSVLDPVAAAIAIAGLAHATMALLASDSGGTRKRLAALALAAGTWWLMPIRMWTPACRPWVQAVAEWLP